jgi:Ca2+-binding RTX toxin-like protein
MPRFYGDDSSNTVIGTWRNDLIFLLDSNDTAFGRRGDDRVWDGDGDDVLYGGQGSDRFDGMEGNNSCYGGDGDDIFTVSPDPFTIRGGSGIDALDATVLFVAGDQSIRINANGRITLAGQGVCYGMEALLAHGGAGNDTFEGGIGGDVLFGGGGSDLLIGNEGDDVFKVAGSGFSVRGGAGVDRLQIGLGNPPNDLVIRLNEAGIFDLPGFGRATGIEAIEIVSGRGDDVLSGGSERDLLDGADGNDLLFGSGGDDRLAGGAGTDTLRGGVGNDIFFAGPGADIVKCGDGDDGSADTFGIAGDDDDRIWGEAGNDRLNANFGNDVLHGGDGADSLDGGIGEDVLRGDAGHDSLFGRDGADTLTGGADDDAFVFLRNDDSRRRSQADVITDFVAGLDTIDVSFVDAKEGGPAFNDAFTFVGAFTGAPGEVVVRTVGANRHFLEFNTDDDARLEMVIDIRGDAPGRGDLIL